MEELKTLQITVRSDFGGGPKYLNDFMKAILGYKSIRVAVAAPAEEPFGPVYKVTADAFFELPHRKFRVLEFFRLLKFLKREQIEIVHSHGRGAGIYSRLLKLFGFKVIHTFHGIHREPSFLGRIKFWLDRSINFLTDGYMFVSQSEKESAIKAGFKFNKPYEVVYPIASSKLASSSTGDDGIFKFACIARYDYAKGLDILMLNLLEFRKRYPEILWSLKIAGSGQKFIFTVPDAIVDRVHLLGNITKPLDFLATQDVYLACSRWEGLSISVLEAISQGLPSLISNVSGHDYFIREKVAFGFELENKDEFCDKLYEICVAKKRLEIPQSFFKKHSVENMREKYLRLLNEVTGTKNE